MIKTYEFFTFKKNSDDWWEIFKTFDENGNSINLKGFVHKSRIQPLYALADKEKRKIIKETFDKELEFIKTKNWDERKKHHEPKFDMILNVAVDYITKTKDKELFRTFIEIVKLDTGSADEMPSWTLGSIFIKQPDWTIEQIRNVGLTQDLIDRLDFGFENVGCCRIRGSGKGGFFGGFLSGCDGFLQHGDVSLKCGGTLALTRRKFLGGAEFTLGRGQDLIGLAFLQPLAGDQGGEHEAADGVDDGQGAGFHASRVGGFRLETNFFDSSISDGIEHAENLLVASLGIGGDEDASFVWLGFGFEARGDF